MCGIAGILLRYPETSISHRIQKMGKSLAHRGPDGDGYLLVDEALPTAYSGEVKTAYRSQFPYLPKHLLTPDCKGSLAFAHRRLSVIDLSETGHQPMCDADAHCWITYNGEIYNYKELRSELQAKGRRFQSQSDTEVILNAYLEWGAACVERFNGMWSFCIYDSNKNCCFLSRDRAGVKPLYYFRSADKFVFASEQKALIASGWHEASADEEALRNYLIASHIDQGDISFFKGIEEFPPGHSMFVDLKHLTIELTRYHDFSTSSSLTVDYPVLVEKTRAAVDQSIRLRLRSDVPVGTCLSGGIDSSILLSAMSRMESQPVHAFTASFPNTSSDESAFAKLVANKAHAIHHIITPTLEAFIQQVDEIIFAQDTPIWDTSTFAQHSVMKLAHHSQIKVVLDGQGADELFGGYHHHFFTQWRELILNSGWIKAYKAIQSSEKSIPSPFIFFLKESWKPRKLLLGNKAALLLNKEFIEENWTVSDYASNLNDQLVLDIQKNRLRPFLKCEDRASMHYSVESRTPFSDDPNLFQLAFSIPGEHKIKNGVSKSLLRDAYKDLLPNEILNRYDKKGFETPSENWYAAMRPLMVDYLQSVKLPMVNYKLLARYRGNNDKLLFRLFIYARWLRLFTKTA